MNTIGSMIKQLRCGNNPYGISWTQEKLGQLLNPPVKRAAINKWELGKTQTIKKYYIEQLAKIFGVKPSDLMCFDDQNENSEQSEEDKVIEQVHNYYGKDAVRLLQLFNELNVVGRQKALEDISDLTEHPKYCNEEVVQLLQLFNDLNVVGRQKVIENTGDLVECSKYRKI